MTAWSDTYPDISSSIEVAEEFHIGIRASSSVFKEVVEGANIAVHSEHQWRAIGMHSRSVNGSFSGMSEARGVSLSVEQKWVDIRTFCIAYRQQSNGTDGAKKKKA